MTINDNILQLIEENSLVDYQTIFNKIKLEFKKLYNWNIDYLKLKITDTPVFNNGKPNLNMKIEEFGGCWTKQGIIYINNNLQQVIDYYNANMSLEKFTILIIAHESAHEVYNNILTNKEREVYKDITKNFTSPYIDTLDSDYNKLMEEKFCEYIAHEITKKLY